MADDDTQTIDTIRLVASDIEANKSKQKTITEQIDELLEDIDEYHDVQEAQEKLDEAKQKLAARLQGNGRYNELQEKLADKKQAVKADQETLSTYVVEYYRQTGAKQVEIDETNGDAREVIIVGKLGKKGKFQTDLFSGNDHE